MTNENLVTIDIDDEDDSQHYIEGSSELQQQTSQGLSLMPEVSIYESSLLQRSNDECETLLNESQPLLDHHDHFQSITYNQFPGLLMSITSANFYVFSR